MDLLVSLCNRDDDHPEALVFVDTVSEAVLPVALPERGLGAMGLAHSGDYLFVVVRLGRPEPEAPERSRLYTLDAATLAPLAEYDFALGRDVHSLMPWRGDLYAVSTGTDELLRLTLEGPEVAAEEVHWRPEPAAPREDVNHLNAVYFFAGGLVVSGFGRRPEGRDWKEARQGGVWRVHGERLGPALYQPHSLLAQGAELLVCESPQRLLRSLDGQRRVALSGYTRGLALEDGDVWCGLSLGRKQSKSSGTINNLAAPGAIVAGECGVVRLDGRTLKVQGTISLERYGREVYDLLPLARPFPGA